jgi:ribosomal protein S18 acetylase RimI-like enzyme
VIRKYLPTINESDFNQLKSSYLQMVNDPDTLRYLSYTLKPFDEQTVITWLRTHLENDIEYHVASNSDGQIVGISILKFNVVYGFELLGLVVHHSQRQKGLGRNLVEYLVSIARQQGFSSIEVSVFADNKPMLLLLIDLDFIPVRITAHARADGMDVVHLKKYINSI